MAIILYQYNAGTNPLWPNVQSYPVVDGADAFYLQLVEKNLAPVAPGTDDQGSGSGSVILRDGSGSGTEEGAAEEGAAEEGGAEEGGSEEGGAEEGGAEEGGSEEGGAEEGGSSNGEHTYSTIA